MSQHAHQGKPEHRYFFHLSDLHFGDKHIEAGAQRLRELLKSHVSSMNPNDHINFVVTGDAVDTPRKKNSLKYREFSVFLESLCGTRPLFVLGNHDVNPYGLALCTNRREHMKLAGKFPRLKIFEDIKTIFLLFNSNKGGHLAEGEIGATQMADMEHLLDDIDDLEAYTLIAVLHHHIVPIENPETCEEPWYMHILPKKLFEQILEETRDLHDADAFLDFLQRRNICIVLHGHKHIPCITQHEGISIISCGSSTGQTSHKHKDPLRTHLSYNLLELQENSLSCTQLTEEQRGAGTQIINTATINY